MRTQPTLGNQGKQPMPPTLAATKQSKNQSPCQGGDPPTCTEDPRTGMHLLLLTLPFLPNLLLPEEMLSTTPHSEEMSAREMLKSPAP